MVAGDVGLHPGTAVTGFGPGADAVTQDGPLYVADGVALQATSDLDTAYTSAAGQTPVTEIPTELGGTTLSAGVYDSASGTFGVTGPLTLDAEGDPGAVFVLQMGTTLTTASASTVNLINGADVCNVDGTLEVPPTGFPAGWYTGAPTPGELGPAIIAGHVDLDGEPGVFFELRHLTPGDEIQVSREDGSTARFRVDRVERFAKDRFPTELVYADLDHAGLRLITCGGDFDQQVRSYEDNLVVFARLSRGPLTIALRSHSPRQQVQLPGGPEVR